MSSASVLRLDPDLGAGIPADRRDAAEQACLARVSDIPEGDWDAESTAGHDRTGFGLLVLSGNLCRRVMQEQHYGAELLGPGDLLRPWDRIGGWSSIPADSNWVALSGAKVAVLDAAFARRCSPFPQVATSLIRRGLQRSRYLAIMIAIVGQRKVETRLTMLFWHLADRFGTVRGGWVEIPVPLTHSLLGELVGARRPSISTALAGLEASGVLMRDGRAWKLKGPAPVELEQQSDL